MHGLWVHGFNRVAKVKPDAITDHYYSVNLQEVEQPLDASVYTFPQ